MSKTFIQAFCQPQIFPHPTTAFDVIETHISWVILTGAFAYKIKKPVDFGFLNFTTLEARKRFCDQELLLNRRLNPELYLEVVAITGSCENPVINGDGQPFEYALKMVQFPTENILSEMQTRGELTGWHLDDLTLQLAKFHQETPSVPMDLPWGNPDAVMAPVLQNFDQIRTMLPPECDVLILNNLEAWAKQTYPKILPLLLKRKQDGYIRECHGDLHLGNAALFKEKVRLFDCIEFNDDFRCTDTMADIAFLLMDLRHRQLPALASRVLNLYLSETGDYEGVALLKFYESYRAVVRAKVALFGLSPNISEAERGACIELYNQYMTLAESYSHAHRSRLLVMVGVSGSGKSVVAEQLVESHCAITIRSDVLRLRQTQPIVNRYDASSRDLIYKLMFGHAHLLLSHGYNVILDATFLSQSHRDQAMALAKQTHSDLNFVVCEANESTLLARIHQRKNDRANVSEADEAVLKQQQISWQPLSVNQASMAVHVDTQNPASISSCLKNLLGQFGS